MRNELVYLNALHDRRARWLGGALATGGMVDDAVRGRGRQGARVEFIASSPFGSGDDVNVWTADSS